MGHSCNICGRTRANEKFSGKGHRQHVCKDCMKNRNHESEDNMQELVPSDFSFLLEEPNDMDFNIYDFDDIIRIEASKYFDETDIDCSSNELDDDDLPF